MQNWLHQYRVILILFVYLLLATALYALLSNQSPMTFLMGLFFITFSFFKAIHLRQFANSFNRYDLIAKALPFYALAYPFIEISLGILFLSNAYLWHICLITIVILLSTNIGVIMALRKGQILECACLGVVFKLPLSNITVVENSLMIAMATMQLYLLTN